MLWVAAIKNCQDVPVFMCFPSMLWVLLGGIWYSEVKKEITLICNVELSQWLMEQQVLQNSTQRENKETETAQADDKGHGWDAGQKYFYWWSCHIRDFCARKHLTLHCDLLILWRVEVFSQINSEIYWLYECSVILMCLTRKEAYNLQGSDIVGKVALLTWCVILKIYVFLPVPSQGISLGLWERGQPLFMIWGKGIPLDDVIWSRSQDFPNV